MPNKTMLQEPIIHVNDKYTLSFTYPDWCAGHNVRVTYTVGRLSDGNVGYVRSPNAPGFDYGARKTAKEMTDRLVYEDEGTFGSAGLFHNGNYKSIKLVGFHKAVEKYSYQEKWNTIATIGFDEYTKRLEERLRERYGDNVHFVVM